MSLFSQKLSELVSKQGAKLYRVADLCGLDRSNIYKCLRGERLPGSAADVQALGRAMQLTPSEQAALLEAYHISKEGDEAYFRREKINAFLSAFSRLPQKELDTLRCVPDAGEAAVCTGEANVNGLLCRVLEGAEAACLFIQPECGPLLSYLKALSVKKPGIRLRHMLCLERGNALYNLDCLQSAAELFLALPGYRPSYFFRNNGLLVNSVLPPWLLVTEEAALQLTYDMKACVCHRNKAAVRLFQTAFDAAAVQAAPLLSPLGRVGTGSMGQYSYGGLTASVYREGVAFSFLRQNGSRQAFIVNEASLCKEFCDFFKAGDARKN